MQVMALSVNGVCMDEGGNGEGQGRVGLEVNMLLVQDKSCFSQGSIYLCFCPLARVEGTAGQGPAGRLISGD